MKMYNFKESFKSFCRKVGKRNFIIFGAVMLVAVAVGVNLIFFAGDRNDGFHRTVVIKGFANLDVRDLHGMPPYKVALVLTHKNIIFVECVYT